MVRTQVQLTEKQASALKMKAAAMGVSMAELIRQGLISCLNSMAASLAPNAYERFTLSVAFDPVRRYRHQS